MKGCLITGSIFIIIMAVIGSLLPPEDENLPNEPTIKTIDGIEYIEKPIEGSKESEQSLENDPKNIFKRYTKEPKYPDTFERIHSGRPPSADHLPYEDSVDFLAQQIVEQTITPIDLLGRRLTFHGQNTTSNRVVRLVGNEERMFLLYLIFRNPRNGQLTTSEQYDYVIVEGTCDDISISSDGWTTTLYFTDSEIITNYGSIWGKKEFIDE